jgi:metallo-beta-lactamase family protein
MGDFISCQDASKVKKVFLVHGEYESAQFYANYISQRGFQNIEIPKSGNEFVLN